MASKRASYTAAFKLKVIETAEKCGNRAAGREYSSIYEAFVCSRCHPLLVDTHMHNLWARIRLQQLAKLIITQHTALILQALNNFFQASQFWKCDLYLGVTYIPANTVLFPALVIILVVCVCVSVCYPYSSKPSNNASYPRFQQLQLDKTKEAFSTKILHSQVMVVFSQLSLPAVSSGTGVVGFISIDRAF